MECMPREKARRRAAPVAVGLSRSAIIEAALAEIDRGGLPAFSLRGLARALGVNANVVVWHVGNRDAVIAEVVAHVLHGVVPPEAPEEGWEARLRGLFTRFRAAMRKHPHTAPLIGADAVSNLRPDLPLVEAILSALEEAGVRPERICETYNTVQAALVGFVTQELARLPTEDLPGWQAGIRAGLEAVDPERFPTLVRHLPRLVNRAFILRWQNGAEMPMESSFTAFVDCVIAGIAASLTQSRSPDE